MPCDRKRTVGCGCQFQNPFAREKANETSRLQLTGDGPIWASSQQNRALPGFEELAMPLFDSLYNLARWLAQNQNDAEDLVQETYLKALRSYASFEPGTNFRAWIFQILRNTFLGSCSTLERRMTLAMDSEEDLPATSATPESLLIGSSDIDAVRSAIEQLPVIFREVILL
jgi:RNA polymerase sigma factor (sigma-70 family)